MPSPSYHEGQPSVSVDRYFILGASIALLKSFSCIVDMILRGGGFSEESLLV